MYNFKYLIDEPAPKSVGVSILQKTNKFEIVFSPSFNKFGASVSTDYKIINLEALENKHILKVELNNGFSSNQLLVKMIEFGNIISFKEIIPTMNDIFIKVVNDAKQEEKIHVEAKSN